MAKKVTKSTALRDRLLAKVYGRRTMDIGDEPTEFWIRKLSPAVYMELFGSAFADLKAAQVGFEATTPQEVANQMLVMDKVIIAGTVADNEDGTPSREPLFDDESLTALSIAEKNALAVEIMQWSGITPEARDTAQSFRTDKAGESEAGASGQ